MNKTYLIVILLIVTNLIFAQSVEIKDSSDETLMIINDEGAGKSSITIPISSKNCDNIKQSIVDTRTSSISNKRIKDGIEDDANIMAKEIKAKNLPKADERAELMELKKIRERALNENEKNQNIIFEQEKTLRKEKRKFNMDSALIEKRVATKALADAKAKIPKTKEEEKEKRIDVALKEANLKLKNIEIEENK